MQPNHLSACEAAQAIRQGELSSEQLVQACLQRISEREADVGAFAFLDTQLALAQARTRDEQQKNGESLGPLHGLPVAVKDVIDTMDMPTEYGSPIFSGRQPQKDSHVVSKLREAGAVILGKTISSELATPTAGPTKNPLDLSRTPGGSSSGSAASVADYMAPLSIGTQTKGSVLRPASYCGIVGYKPSHGLIGRGGTLHQSWLLDHIGVFARNLEDAALLAPCMMGYDPQDPYTKAVAPPNLLASARKGLDRAPRLLFVKGSPWKFCQPGTEAIFENTLDQWRKAGVEIIEQTLPETIDRALVWIEAMLGGEWSHCFGPLYKHAKDQLSPALQALIEKGFSVPAHEYVAACEQVPLVARHIEELLTGFDAIITLPASGEAESLQLKISGNPIFCSIWTFAGAPALSLPLCKGPHALPLGVQLVGAKGADAKLFATAASLQATI